MPQSKKYNYESEMICSDCKNLMTLQKRSIASTGFIWRCQTCRKNRFPRKERSEVEELTPLCECHGETMTFIGEYTSKGYYWKCRIEYNETQKNAKRKRYKDNPLKARENARKTYLKSKFQISPEDYNEKVQAQNGLCALCDNVQNGKYDLLDIDHSHKTGQIRALLCMHCNTSLGFYEIHAEAIMRYMNRKHLEPSMDGYEKLSTKHPDYIRSREYERKYGISLKIYNLLLDEQNGVCYICSKRPKEDSRIKFLVVDHDHDTNLIRGLLCIGCNFMMGHIDKRIPDLERYIREYE